MLSASNADACTVNGGKTESILVRRHMKQPSTLKIVMCVVPGHSAQKLGILVT